jgi:hypothetical protein
MLDKLSNPHFERFCAVCFLDFLENETPILAGISKHNCPEKPANKGVFVLIAI